MAQKKSESFGQMMDRLEKIVSELESDSLDLEKAMKTFEEGVTLTKKCSQSLKEAEKKIEILLRDADGNLNASEFDPGLDEEEPDE